MTFRSRGSPMFNPFATRPMPGELLQVVTTVADKTEAERLAASVLEKRLAACVQIIGPIDSHYWWNGRLEKATEYSVLMKTHVKMYAKLEKLLLEEHPYDEPEVIATIAEHVSPGYLQWLKDELRLK